MRILYHHRTFGDGAEGIHIHEMIQAFRDLGHEVDLVCPHGASRTPGMRTTQSSAATWGTWIRKSIPAIVYSFLEIAYNIASYLAVRRAVRTKKPDLVYERYSSFSFGGMLASVRAGIPVILEVNLTYTGAFGSDHPVHFMSIARKIESFAFRRSTGIAVVSEPLRTSLVEMGEAKEKIIVTRNAINDAFVKSFDIDRTRHEIRSQLGWTDNLIVGFVGSLRSWHGVDLLMGAIPDVLGRVPNARFIIVGTGELEGILRKFVEEQRVADRTILTGGVPHADVFRYISAMDIALMPNSNSYGSPMKVLEYMAMARATVAPRLKPLEEIITDGITGRLVEPGHQEALSSAIVELARDPELRDRLGKNARDSVLNNHTWIGNARHVLNLYEMLNSKRKSQPTASVLPHCLERNEIG